jgi:hypothetical protein
MRRNFLFSIMPVTIITAALLPAGSAWAAPNAGNSATHYLNQISDQAYQIETQADRLEAYLRSGAHDQVNSAGFTMDIAEGAQKLWVLLDQVAAQPGATNDTRMRVRKMKSMTSELMAFTGNAFNDVETQGLALHLNSVFANTANIEERCDIIRNAAQALANTH